MAWAYLFWLVGTLSSYRVWTVLTNFRSIGGLLLPCSNARPARIPDKLDDG